MVPKQTSNRCTVQEALTDMRWVQDIHGVASVDVLREFNKLCDFIIDITLQPGVVDVHRRRLSSLCQYSASSAYTALFQGSTQFGPLEWVWKTWVTEKCLFFLWLVKHDCCWTANRLVRRNLPHPENCPCVTKK
ncbi:hypothetical protein PR202_ga27888 [Eleusine coracana subsp. coracana]|uniref:Reverse transcriptase zinc-binding domain-containing protein n=1 Tax=Eleusine coracana subsp. coracana TaxID=191504 RepID=A0AAV5DH46_ELECO|nr:hypothetical protein PR202_ga27888 [Eleusine coracana subsp. coracana]